MRRGRPTAVDGRRVPVIAGSVAGVPLQVRTEVTTPRTLAAVRAVTTPRQLGTDIIRCLDQVWPLLRAGRPHRA
jgi:hypothetical protein